MSATRPIATRATKARPCPVCGCGSKGCSATDDRLHLCRGEPRSGWRRVTRQADPAGFDHYRREDDDRHQRNGHHGRRSTAGDEPKNWPALARRYARALTPALRRELADSLGLPVEALDLLPGIGWCEPVTSWTFPEVDAAGAITGVLRRPRTGKKVRMAGSRCGLHVPPGWRERPGPVHAPEGPTDVLSLTLCGLPAVGRRTPAGSSCSPSC